MCYVRTWWRNQPPARQDKLAALAPVMAAGLFLVAIIVSFVYLRSEEMAQERDALVRDMEYAQQHLRLRLLERQDQVMRLAHDLTHPHASEDEFLRRADTLVAVYPELQTLTWISASGQIIASRSAITAPVDQLPTLQTLAVGPLFDSFQAARTQRQPVYAQPAAYPGGSIPTLHVQVPILTDNIFLGTVLAEYALDNLLRYGVPLEVLTRYAVSLWAGPDQHLTGAVPRSAYGNGPLGWVTRQYDNSYMAPFTLVGEGLLLRGTAYRAAPGLADGGLFWLAGLLSLLTLWLLFGTWRHTRRRMAAQQALLVETNFRRAMENSVLTGLRVLDLQGRITYVNAAFCQMTGYAEEELLGSMPPYPYWREQDHADLLRRLAEQVQGRFEPTGVQFTVRRKNGTVFDAHLYVSPLIDPHGQHTGWMSSMTDITESNRIRNQIMASHDRFTIVLEALDASVSVTPLGRAELLFANKLYRQWFGAQADGHLQLVQQAGVLRGHNAARADIQGDDEDGLMGLPSDSVTSAHTKNAEIYLPALGRWLEVRSRYLSWVDGRLAQMVIATDITPRRQAEEQAAQQAERAQAASRLITMGEMASSVAHELNQPLTAISNYCNGMLSRLDGGTLTEEQMRFALEKTAHQAQRAGQVIQRIRDFVKRSEPNQTPAQVAGMVNEAVELASIIMRRRNVRLSHHVPPGLPPVMADTILIEQVLVNLMKNAAESIDQAERPAGQRSVELRVGLHTLDGRPGVEFSVQDTGKGLPPEVLDRLFEAFFTTKREGMGIGLNLCRSIVESHGGRMQAQNIYNGPLVIGCRFSFWLPLADTSAYTPEQGHSPYPDTEE